MLRKSKHLTIVQQKVRSGYNMIQLQYAYKCIWMFYMKMVCDEIEILRMEFGVHLYWIYNVRLGAKTYGYSKNI